MTQRPASPESIAALNRARDLDAQTGQGDKRLVFSLCGNVYQCMTGLPDPTLDLEPRPRREYPNSRIGFGVNDAAGQRHSLLRRLDATESSHPPQVVFHQDEDGVMKATQMPGVFAGLEAQHPFQVMYGGAGTWVVGAGEIRVDDEPLQIDRKSVQLTQGWVCVSSTWLVPSVNAYTLQGASIVGVSDLSVPPPLWSLDDGVLKVGEGPVLHPIAYVSERTGQRPLIQQSLTTNLLFFPSMFPWGLLGPRSF